MALAPYYDKAANAAAQVVAGFDPSAFQRSLEGTVVGLSFADQAATSREGGALLDLTVRLLARLYPTLAFRPSGPAATQLAEQLKTLACAINPRLEFTHHADVGIAVGVDATPWIQTIYAGSDAWQGRVSVTDACVVGDSDIPFGAGAAACLSASAIFRLLLDPTAPTPGNAELSCLHGATPILEADLTDQEWSLPARTVLVGAGAIGQAAIWALARSPLTGTLHIADHEPIDPGNLQRYVLSTTADTGKPKATFAAGHIKAGAAGGWNRLTAVAHDTDWVGARAEAGTDWEAALAAVDSAAARRAVQASLPRWTANAWTQPGDLGASDHNFLGGACIACLYLPAGRSRNEDELVAEALGVPDLLYDVRTLLYHGAPPPSELLATIAARLGVDLATVTEFNPRSIRDLYVRGICGGAVVPLRSGAVHADVHVPLAHQSALAGVLLAARLARRAAGIVLSRTEVTRLDIRSNPPAQPTQLAAKDPRRLCICQDDDYLAAFCERWPSAG